MRAPWIALIFGAWWVGVLRPGPMPVGFTSVMLTDATRAIQGRPRHVQLAVWYPAAASARPPMTYAGYIGLAGVETTDAPSDVLEKHAVDSVRAFLRSVGVPDSVVTQWFSSPVLGVRDAPRAVGTFPLVLVAQGNGETAADQSVLCEYLASYGYVVATSPSQSRLTGQPDEESAVGRAAEDQTDDLALLRARVSKEWAVAGTAIVGHSFGARSALLLAMRDSSVRAIVSLDGGIGTATARASLQSAPSFRRDVKVSILHFYEDLDRFMIPDWGMLTSLQGARVWIASTSDLHHHHFSDIGAASGRFPPIAAATRATGATGGSYAAVLERTRNFLDGIVRGDTAASTKSVRDSGQVHVRQLNAPSNQN